MKQAGILGIGAYVPEKILTNQELEDRIDTTDEWIRTRTGIHQRRLAAESEETADLAEKSAREALSCANLSPNDLDLILVATATAERRLPSVACQVQHRLGATNAAALDVAAACSGFMYALSIAQQFIQTGTYRHVLVIGAEKLSSIVDWTDRNTCVLFGDASAAMILGEVSKDRGILAIELGADGSGGDHLYTDPLVHMNGSEVFKFAVRQMGDASLAAIKKAGITKEDVDFLIPHQANIRIIEAARRKLGLPKEKVSVTLDRYGNTSSASIPLSFHHEVQRGAINDGDLVVLVGFGGGLTWGSIVLRYGQ